MASTKVQRIMTQPINLIFRFLQSKARIQIWLFEQKDVRIEGRIIKPDGMLPSRFLLDCYLLSNEKATCILLIHSLPSATSPPYGFLGNGLCESYSAAYLSKHLRYETNGRIMERESLHTLSCACNLYLSNSPCKGTPRPNKDLVGTLAQLQCMDGQEHHKQMQSPGQLGQFSGSHSQQNWMPERFPASHLDLMERSWLGLHGQLQITSIESQLTQLHHVAEKHKRKYGIFSKLDACSFVANVYDKGSLVSLVTHCSPHGTHVAGIAIAQPPSIFPPPSSEMLRGSYLLPTQMQSKVFDRGRPYYKRP